MPPPRPAPVEPRPPPVLELPDIPPEPPIPEPPIALCDPEVEDLDLVDATAGEDQVGRLEIAVDDPARVRGAERLGDPRDRKSVV